MGFYCNQTLNHLQNRKRTFLQYGPVAQTGRALPLQGRGPGFKSRWVHFISAAPFCRETGVKGKYLNDFPCISNPTSTN